MSRRGYTPESKEAIADRFGFGYDFLAGPDEIAKVCNVTDEKFREAETGALVIASEGNKHAKAVIFSALDEPEVMGWLEFTRCKNSQTYRLTHEYETARLMATYGGMIGIKSMTYDITTPSATIPEITVVGFKPSMVDTEDDRKYAAAALEHDKDPFGIGEEATAYFVDGEEQELRQLSLNALHGIQLGVNKDKPTLEITNLKDALKLLSGMALITTPITQNLYLDIKFSEPVRPDTDHNLAD